VCCSLFLRPFLTLVAALVAATGFYLYWHSVALGFHSGFVFMGAFGLLFSQVHSFPSMTLCEPHAFGLV
jgi:hypothetical protein